LCSRFDLRSLAARCRDRSDCATRHASAPAPAVSAARTILRIARYFFGSVSAGGVVGGGGVPGAAIELLDESDGGGVGVVGVDGEVIGALLVAGGGGGGGGASLLQPATSAAAPSMAIMAIVVFITCPSLDVRTAWRAAAIGGRA
jgi:hypothetical protein